MKSVRATCGVVARSSVPCSVSRSPLGIHWAPGAKYVLRSLSLFATGDDVTPQHLLASLLRTGNENENEPLDQAIVLFQNSTLELQYRGCKEWACIDRGRATQK